MQVAIPLLLHQVSQSGSKNRCINSDTTVKTGDFTATDGSGFVNAAGGQVTVTLGSPSAEQ